MACPKHSANLDERDGLPLLPAKWEEKSDAPQKFSTFFSPIWFSRNGQLDRHRFNLGGSGADSP